MCIDKTFEHNNLVTTTDLSMAIYDNEHRRSALQERDLGSYISTTFLTWYEIYTTISVKNNLYEECST